MRGIRLGFWNRLAVVIGLLTTFVAPSWGVLSSNIDMAEAKRSGHVTCLDAAKDSSAIKICDEIWLSDLGYSGWGYWWQAVAGTALAVAAIYSLIWLIVWIAKWVWRGRSV